MNIDVRDSELVFRDLSDALNDLEYKRNSPVEVRRSFARFLTLSQQLTETMRKEFKRITGQDWAASNFDKWNAITDFFKKLRRSDYHEFPLIITVRENQYYPVSGIYEDVNDDGYLVVDVTWGIGDPFSEKIPQGMELCLVDGESGLPIENKCLKPEKIEYEFILVPRTDEIAKSLETAGTDDLHELSKQCFCVLRDYYNYYVESIAKRDTRVP